MPPVFSLSHNMITAFHIKRTSSFKTNPPGVTPLGGTPVRHVHSIYISFIPYKRMRFADNTEVGDDNGALVLTVTSKISPDDSRLTLSKETRDGRYEKLGWVLSPPRTQPNPFRSNWRLSAISTMLSRLEDIPKAKAALCCATGLGSLPQRVGRHFGGLELSRRVIFSDINNVMPAF